MFVTSKQDLWRKIERILPTVTKPGRYAVSYTHLDVYKRQEQNNVNQEIF